MMLTTPPIPPPHLAKSLTPIERLVLCRVADGFTDAEIATILSRSKDTVRYHVKGLKAYLGISRREVLVRFAVRAKLVEM